MARDILKEIVDARKADIEKSGWEFGFDIPPSRSRSIHPFLAEKGAILEVKRASPSKGDIAPNLDPYETARSYCEAGAKGISCLTETRRFKGTLGDLMDVCRAVDDFERETGKEGPAVLRKDFLFDERDIDVAFRAGADAVLLIARILNKELMLRMAKRAESLGISALIEVRKDEDLEKLAFVLERVGSDKILCGVNSRDLKDFSIDLLIPASRLRAIRSIEKNARVAFESGILSPSSARFAASMGFSAILLGEAAAKNPKNAAAFTEAFAKSGADKNGEAWVELASTLIEKKEKPLVKVCGITNEQDALMAARLGADFLGFIFWKKSKRAADIGRISTLRDALMAAGTLPKLVGVVVDTQSVEAKEAYRLIEAGTLDFIQVHTFDSAMQFVANPSLVSIPHWCAVNISRESDIERVEELNRLGEARILIDAQSGREIGGTGKTIAAELAAKVGKAHKLWLAGGISPENVAPLVAALKPELIDVSSSLEKEPGIKDHEKLRAFFSALRTERA